MYAGLQLFAKRWSQLCRFVHTKGGRRGVRLVRKVCQRRFASCQLTFAARKHLRGLLRRAKHGKRSVHHSAVVVCLSATVTHHSHIGATRTGGTVVWRAWSQPFPLAVQMRRTSRAKWRLAMHKALKAIETWLQGKQ